MTLIFVTGNKNKFEEAKNLSDNYDVKIEHRNISYVEIQADELIDVVKPSAQQACEMVGAPCFVEDAGLFIDSLNGFPGPYSSYVFKTVGNEGILRLMEGIPEEDRSAKFRSAVAYCEPGGEPEVFVGEVEGAISKEMRGSKGFGYDPIFLPERGGGGTFAEMSTEMKNYLSHRAKAIEKLVKWYTRNKKADGD